MKAECQCGQLTAKVPEKPLITIACHCTACQRRTGAPFGVLAYHRRDQVSVTGGSKAFTRISDAGNAFETHFCPVCGSTVYATLSKQPGLIGIAIGTMADPDQAAPVWSVWEQSRHHWVTLPEDMKHFEQNGQP